jgi:hypothetical protein
VRGRSLAAAPATIVTATRLTATRLAALLLAGLVACHPSMPVTRAERSHFTETSHYADVVAFLDALRTRVPAGIDAEFGTIGVSTQGRALPYVRLTRAAAGAPATVADCRPVVYVQANIHAGEVEGKEALLIVLRELLRARGPSVLDSIVLIAVPIYNADGNEAFGPEERQRTEQNGPAVVGQRPNGQGLDLNRDYVKAEAPETRASLAAFARWSPDVFVDLHTTDGSFHGYALTYAPSLWPGADPYTRDSLLPELRRRMQGEGFATFDYGNFAGDEGERVAPGAPAAWRTYDDRPRFGTNYVGLRGRTAILSEAYSHDPFERRIAATAAFVREILSVVAERRARFCAERALPLAADVPIRAELTPTPYRGVVVREPLESTGDSSVSQPGVPRGMRRSGRFLAESMAVADRFIATATRRAPVAYVIPGADSAVAALLTRHGLVLRRLGADTVAWTEAFHVDSVVRAATPFQGHRTTRVTGAWLAVGAPSTFPVGDWLVPGAQPLSALAVYLLEPDSDDGLVTWNLFDADLRPGGVYPVRRLRPSP